MAETTLLSAGCRDVDEAELGLIEAPESTQTWFPVPHSSVLERVQGTLGDAGFEITEQRLTVSHNNHRFFGTLTLRSVVSDGVSLAVGVRNSTDKSFPIGFVGGSRVFVCSNLCFSGEIYVAKKHTRFGETRYREGLAAAVTRLGQFQQEERQRIAWLQQAELSAPEADSLILRSYEQGIIGARMLPNVIKEWREPSHEEFAPRTMWSLLNCFTEVWKDKAEKQPNQVALSNMSLLGLLQKEKERDASSITIEATAV